MKICLITYSFYETDPRVQREVAWLEKRGHNIDIICLREEGKKRVERINGVKLYRVQKRIVNEKHPLDYLMKILRFFIWSSFLVGYLHVVRKYHFVQIITEPDFLVFSALFPKILGAKVVMDMHELVPEMYARKFNLSSSHVLIRILKLVEKISIRFADHVFTSTEIWKKTLCSRSLSALKCTVLINVPDRNVFCPIHNITENGYFNMICRGVFRESWGIDVIIKAVQIVKNSIPNMRLHIYGHGPDKDQYMNLIKQLQLNPYIQIHDPISNESFAKQVSRMNLGICAIRDGVYAGDCLSQSTLEFMTVRIPVVASRTRASEHYFSDKMVAFFEPENEKELAQRIMELYKDQDAQNELIRHADQFISMHPSERYESIYCDTIQKIAKRSK